MFEKKKKEKYKIKKSLIGNGKDYHVYKMNILDYLIGYFLGFAISFFILQIFFENLLLSLIVSLIVGIKTIGIYRNFLVDSKKKKLLLQFKDFLESLTSSFSAGKNTISSFTDAYNDLQLLYGDEADITKEMYIILLGLDNGYNIEELLDNFAQRSGLDDINSFASTFRAANRMGGNLKEIIADTRQIINDKIDIELEIKTTVASKKNELYIMTCMPIIIITCLKGMGDESFSPSSPINFILRIIVLIIVIISFLIGKKITDIKV